MYVAEQGKHSPSLTYFTGDGIHLAFQDGTVKIWGPNGTTNEEVIQVLVDRLTSLQDMDNRKYACKENACAITHLQEALHWLESRTKARLARGVEGTNVA